MTDKSTLKTVTKLELAIKERELADIADELHELGVQQSKEIEALRESLVASVAQVQKTIEELYNAK